MTVRLASFDLYDRIMAAIEAVPGVQSCTMSVMPLVARSEWEEPVQPDGAGLPKNAFIQIARWNFLETMGIPLVAGRDLSAADTQGRPRVAVINETMARQVFGERMPVGRHFQFVNGGDPYVRIQVYRVARDEVREPRAAGAADALHAACAGPAERNDR